MEILIATGVFLLSIMTGTLIIKKLIMPLTGSRQNISRYLKKKEAYKIRPYAFLNFLFGVNISLLTAIYLLQQQNVYAVESTPEVYWSETVEDEYEEVIIPQKTPKVPFIPLDQSSFKETSEEVTKFDIKDLDLKIDDSNLDSSTLFDPDNFDLPPDESLTDFKIDNAVIADHLLSQRATFPGGDKALDTFIQKHFNPNSNSTAPGTIMISFVVNIDGSISDIQLLRGINGSLDSEALRVINKFPKWIPAKDNFNREVRSAYIQPIYIK